MLQVGQCITALYTEILFGQKLNSWKILQYLFKYSYKMKEENPSPWIKLICFSVCCSNNSHILTMFSSTQRPAFNGTMLPHISIAWIQTVAHISAVQGKRCISWHKPFGNLFYNLNKWAKLHLVVSACCFVGFQMTREAVILWLSGAWYIEKKMCYPRKEVSIVLQSFLIV